MSTTQRGPDIAARNSATSLVFPRSLKPDPAKRGVLANARPVLWLPPPAVATRAEDSFGSANSPYLSAGQMPFG